MTRPLALGLATLFAGGLVLAAWWVAQGRRSIEMEGAAPAPARSAESPDEELLEPDPLAEPAERLLVPSSPPQMDVRRTAPEDWPRITGRVVLPCRIPDGEDVRVEAVVTIGRANRVLDAPVSSDGAFTLAVPKEATYAELDLRSRFLRMATSVGARPGQKGVLLEPVVFALVEGEIVAPQTLSVAPTHLMAVSWSVDRTAWPGGMRGDSVLPDDDGRFVLEFLPLGVAIELFAENPFGPRTHLQLEPLAAGEKRALEVHLQQGITISGRVIDENGLGVEGATISTSGGNELSPREPVDWPRSDAEGLFVVIRVSPSATRVSAGSPDLVRGGGHATIDGRAGDVRDVLIEVVRGGCIEGTVEWPDGSAVDRFTVTAMAPGDFAREEASGGRFRLCRLIPDDHVVEVHATRDGVAGTARVSDVRPSEDPMRLVLEESRASEVHGTVVDERGEPIGAEVEATNLASPLRSVTATVFHDGSFVLSGLEDGQWSIEAGAPGRQTVKQRVHVSSEVSPSVRFVLAGSGRVLGTVVDRDGAPVQGAWVNDEEGGASRPNLTDGDGRFEFEASATRLRLVAKKTGFSSSAAVELEVAPGATVEGVVLTLRASCRVTGRVLDEQGQPLSGAQVQPGAWGSSAPAQTDARGVFELADLPPGAVTLVAVHPDSRRDGATASAEAVLVAGRETSVELRFERRDPVRVRGRITRAGQPLVVEVFFRSRSFQAHATSGADGRIDLELQRPGAWSGWMVPESERDCLQALNGPADLLQCDLRRFELSVPDADEHAFELDFDRLKRVTSLDELGY